MAERLHQLLLYEYVPDIVERREPHREGHLENARRFSEDGRLVMGGALGDPPHGAAFVFAAEDRAVVEEFVAGDPYVDAGLVTDWRVEAWKVVV